MSLQRVGKSSEIVSRLFLDQIFRASREASGLGLYNNFHGAFGLGSRFKGFLSPF